VNCTDLPPPAANSTLGRTCAACPKGYSGDGTTCTAIPVNPNAPTVLNNTCSGGTASLTISISFPVGAIKPPFVIVLSRLNNDDGHYSQLLTSSYNSVVYGGLTCCTNYNFYSRAEYPAGVTLSAITTVKTSCSI